MFIYGAKTICVLSGLWLKWCFIACYIDDANYSIPALQTFFFFFRKNKGENNEKQTIKC